MILGKKLRQSTVLPEVLGKTIDRIVPRNPECTLRRWEVEPVPQVAHPEGIQHGRVKCVAPGETEVLPATVLNVGRSDGIVATLELLYISTILEQVDPIDRIVLAEPMVNFQAPARFIEGLWII